MSTTELTIPEALELARSLVPVMVRLVHGADDVARFGALKDIAELCSDPAHYRGTLQFLAGYIGQQFRNRNPSTLGAIDELPDGYWFGFRAPADATPEYIAASRIGAAGANFDKDTAFAVINTYADDPDRERRGRLLSSVCALAVVAHAQVCPGMHG
jgi:hypothetical protein